MPDLNERMRAADQVPFRGDWDDVERRVSCVEPMRGPTRRRALRTTAILATTVVVLGVALYSLSGLGSSTDGAVATSRSPGSSGIAGQDFVNGDAPLGEELAKLLGLTLEGPFQSSNGTYTGNCSYFVEVEDNGRGYCLEDIEASRADLAAIAEGLRGHRIDESEWNNIKQMLSDARTPSAGG
jgi:hypothetical protein